MRAESIREGACIDKRRVVRAVTGTATFRVGRSSYLAAARLVTFGNGKVVAYELGTEVEVGGYAEPLPAAGVKSQNVKTPSKVRASSGRWAGESVHGMSTRAHDLIAGTNMFDRERVNGVVGAARGGVGAVALTGQSFPPVSAR